jgi:maltose O-acetyltransferase
MINKLFHKIVSVLMYRLLCASSSQMFPAFLRSKVHRLIGLKLGEGSSVNFGAVIVNPKNVVIGNYVLVNLCSYLDGSGFLYIDDYCTFSPYVKVLTGTHSIMDSMIRRDPRDNVNLTTRIGRGTWIGTGAIILPGVVVGEGCVIGAGSVVTRSTEPNGLYLGAPAKRVRDLTINDEKSNEIIDFYKVS